MKQRQLIVALLCLWLPFQALAGALAHCEQLAHATGNISASRSAPDHGAPVDADCHGHPGERGTTSTEHQHNHQCVHCSGSCHGVQSLMAGADVLAIPFVWPRLETIGNVSVINGFSETPQRPPRKYS